MVEGDKSSQLRMANYPAVLAGYWPLLTALPCNPVLQPKLAQIQWYCTACWWGTVLSVKPRQLVDVQGSFLRYHGNNNKLTFFKG